MQTKQFKYISLIAIFLAISMYGHAQSPGDPNDRLYRYITLWHEKGYIDHTPIIRPYPLQVIKSILNQVMENGDSLSRASASDFYKRIFDSEKKLVKDPPVSLPVRLLLDLALWTEFEDYYAKMKGSSIWDGFFTDYLSYTTVLSFGAVYGLDAPVFPLWTDIPEESRSGGGVIGEDSLDFAQIGSTGIYFGTEDLYLQTGIMRSSFGPFFENGAVIGPQCAQTSHVSWNWDKEWFHFSSVFLDLIPKYQEEPSTGDVVNITSPELKYLILHTVSITPTDWLSLGFLQTVVGGKRFAPAYLIPFQNLFYTQQLYRDYDSSFLGIYSEIDFPAWVQAKFLLYVDDWNAFGGDKSGQNPIFNFDSAQNKFALQAGLSWSPCFDIFKRISLDYLMITPYTYTHNSDSAVPYLSYTHLDYNLGSVLDPNSDQITLNALVTPLSWMDILLRGRFVRHGDASEGLNDGNGSGTIYDDGIIDGDVTFYTPSRFLTQEVIEYVLQTGLDLELRFPFSWGVLAGKIGYTFEYAWNKGLAEGTNEMRHIGSFAFSAEF